MNRCRIWLVTLDWWAPKKASLTFFLYHQKPSAINRQTRQWIHIQMSYDPLTQLLAINFSQTTTLTLLFSLAHSLTHSLTHSIFFFFCFFLNYSSSYSCWYLCSSRQHLYLHTFISKLVKTCSKQRVTHLSPSCIIFTISSHLLFFLTIKCIFKINQLMTMHVINLLTQMYLLNIGRHMYNRLILYTLLMLSFLMILLIPLLILSLSSFFVQNNQTSERK